MKISYRFFYQQPIKQYYENKGHFIFKIPKKVEFLRKLILIIL